MPDAPVYGRGDRRLRHPSPENGGREAAPSSTPDAFATLHELTCGIARRINRLCDLALLIGYAEERKTLTAAHFESVCQELVTIAPE